MNGGQAAHPIFPFTALVGQDELKRALLLAAVDPGIGGVLVSGPRGTAKSTAARALAALLPGPAPGQAAPFVTLPLSASLEQLVGTLNVEDALRDGTVRLAPGLVARAHGGVLYVDEVNLLPDALVDALLDVAASGINIVERDGISQQHAARFVLAGTMNEEEGELRPQLLDRFGLSVALDNPGEPEQRLAILRARLAFDAEPHAVSALHAAQLAQLGEQVARARAGLPALAWTDAVLSHAARKSLAAGVDGVRADLVMLRAARALAALESSEAITLAHVDAVAALALRHRRTQADAPPPPPPPAPRSAPAPAGDGLRQDRPPAGDGGESAPDGDWGALPAQPAGYERVASTGAWLPKKA